MKIYFHVCLDEAFCAANTGQREKRQLFEMYFGIDEAFCMANAMQREKR